MRVPSIAPSRYPRILRASCVLALVALALIVWSLLHPHPIPVIVAMSVAQALGTVSFVTFLAVVMTDLRRGQALQDREGKGASK